MTRAVTTAVSPESKPARVRRMLTWVLVAEIVVIAATGLWLSRYYRPAPSQVWGDAAAGSGLRLGDGIRWVHRWTGIVALVPTALALSSLCLVDGDSDLDRPATLVRVTAAVTLPLLLVAALFTGTLLPYDQLGLWAVTVGSGIEGYQPMFGDEVRFVIVGGAEVTATTVRNVLVVHAAWLPIGIVPALWLARRRSSVG